MLGLNPGVVRCPGYSGQQVFTSGASPVLFMFVVINGSLRNFISCFSWFPLNKLYMQDCTFSVPAFCGDFYSPAAPCFPSAPKKRAKPHRRLKDFLLTSYNGAKIRIRDLWQYTRQETKRKNPINLNKNQLLVTWLTVGQLCDFICNVYLIARFVFPACVAASSLKYSRMRKSVLINSSPAGGFISGAAPIAREGRKGRQAYMHCFPRPHSQPGPQALIFSFSLKIFSASALSCGYKCVPPIWIFL